MQARIAKASIDSCTIASADAELRASGIAPIVRIVDERRSITSAGVLQKDRLAMALDSGLENVFSMRHEINVKDFK
ncbi:hypothetical protein BGZ52_003056 [Haplosporangium bisporale]|nr:hypothetical protein BGZ52_003056 [Haplosporangium bisporale]